MEGARSILESTRGRIPLEYTSSFSSRAKTRAACRHTNEVRDSDNRWRSAKKRPMHR